MPRWSSFQAFLDDALETPLEERQALVDTLLRERPDWPWVEGNTATFIYAKPGARVVAINLDSIREDPPFVQMESLAGTNMWYKSLAFDVDDLLDYMVVVSDPMTPLAEEQDIMTRINRFWQTDPYNPIRISTAQMNVSVLRMAEARPFPDWAKMQRVPHGDVIEDQIDSKTLNFTGRKLWVYTPPGYADSGLVYPLLILTDGQWSVGPLQIPGIADALIKHNRMQPAVIAMIQSGDQANRLKTLVSNDTHYEFLLTELLPYMQTNYRIDSTSLGVGGVDVGAVAAAHAALTNPAVFSRLIMISAPLGKGQAEEKLRAYAKRFSDADVLPQRIFQAVGRYEVRSRFHLPALALRNILQPRLDTDYRFVEIGSGHGLVGFRSIFPEALAWTFPAQRNTEDI